MENTGLPSLKMLSTSTCPSCARMGRVLDDLVEKYGGKVTAEKIDLHENRDIAKQYNVRFVPHLLFVDAEGVVVKEEVGYVPIEQVLKNFTDAGIAIE